MFSLIYKIHSEKLKLYDIFVFWSFILFLYFIRSCERRKSETREKWGETFSLWKSLYLRAHTHKNILKIHHCLVLVQTIQYGFNWLSKSSAQNRVLAEINCLKENYTLCWTPQPNLQEILHSEHSWILSHCHCLCLI